MPVLQVKSSQPPKVSTPDVQLSSLSEHSTLEEEIDAIIKVMRDLHMQDPETMLTSCMALMARATEIHVGLIRMEANMRKAKAFRTMQLAKVIELIEFEFKAASRLVEVRRQEIELSK